MPFLKGWRCGGDRAPALVGNNANFPACLRVHAADDDVNVPLCLATFQDADSPMWCNEGDMLDWSIIAGSSYLQLGTQQWFLDNFEPDCKFFVTEMTQKSWQRWDDGARAWKSETIQFDNCTPEDCVLPDKGPLLSEVRRLDALDTRIQQSNEGKIDPQQSSMDSRAEDGANIGRILQIVGASILVVVMWLQLCGTLYQLCGKASTSNESSTSSADGGRISSGGSDVVGGTGDGFGFGGGDSGGGEGDSGGGGVEIVALAEGIVAVCSE
jgi:hypothetical protein